MESCLSKSPEYLAGTLRAKVSFIDQYVFDLAMRRKRKQIGIRKNRRRINLNVLLGEFAPTTDLSQPLPQSNLEVQRHQRDLCNFRLHL